MSYSGNKKAGK